MFRGIYEIWGDAEDYESVEVNVKQYLVSHKEEIEVRFTSPWTFRLKVDPFGRKYSDTQQKEIMLRFSFMDLLQVGKVCLASPQHVFWIIEDIGENAPRETVPKRVLFTRQVALGSRSLIDRFDVKKRDYIGTTSMDAALSLIISNMAKVKISAIFAGTELMGVLRPYQGSLSSTHSLEQGA